MLPRQSLIAQVFAPRLRRRLRAGRRGESRAVAAERLEERRLLAFDLVAAYASSSEPFYAKGVTGNAITLDTSPQQITLRFSPGIELDPTTLGAITVVTAGPDGSFDTLDDTSFTPVGSTGYIGVDDVPNQNQVVIRFASTLPDDTYRVDIGAGLTTLATAGAGPDTVRPTALDLRIDRGAQVMAVVPQPITRTGTGGLVQSRSTIEVHFESAQLLDEASAETSGFYRLIEVDALGVDVGTPLVPQSVNYTPATGTAVLAFATDLPDGKLFRLEIGGTTAASPAPISEDQTTNRSSFAAAQLLGPLTSDGIVVTGSIAARPTITTPAGPLEQPSPIGARDEVGHRDHPITDSFAHGNQFASIDPRTGLATIEYNFQEVIGVDPQGNTLFNVITENQKQRAREIFELFSLYTGARFVETATGGLTVATGDLRSLVPSIPPSVAGLGGWPAAYMNSNIDWGESEYGGGWFQVAMHEIGHALGLDHSYDLPSIMGSGLSRDPDAPVENVFPGDYDIGHLRQLLDPAGSGTTLAPIGADIDLYRFELPAAGTLTAETVVSRPGQPVLSMLDSVVSLFREETVDGRFVRTLVARNDDYYGRDSFVGLDLEAGSYYIAVTSTGNTSFNAEVPDSGFGGRSEGDYQLRLGFTPRSLSTNTIIDVDGTPIDGDRDGGPGGLFRFWFNTASAADTIYVDRDNASPDGGAGTLASPYSTLSAAVAAAENDPAKRIIRIAGSASGAAYEIGTNLALRPLRDGATFNVPANVTVMIDAGAIFKLRAANIDVGSSSELVSRSGASLQVLGTPGHEVIFTSWHDDSIGGDSDAVGPAPQGGQWGGIVLRADSDPASRRAFVNTIGLANIRFGGGQVLVDSQLERFAPVQLESAFESSFTGAVVRNLKNTRPTIVFNRITNSAGAAIAATPNNFDDSFGRLGPELRGNTLVDNSINGLFVKIDTREGTPLERLDLPARFTSTDIVYVISENLLINGGVGGYFQDANGDIFARDMGRLTIDPGVVVKLQSSRIELERGLGRLYAEGQPNQQVIFTSLGDVRYGAGGTFDTNGNLPDGAAVGDWGGIVLNAGSGASLDHAYLAFGGGTTPIEGSFDQFNVIEVHQGALRLANSRLERNAAGLAESDRNARGSNAAATVFVRGAQPIIVGNDFRDNMGAVISINANALSDVPVPDSGRNTSQVAAWPATQDNVGPLIRGNVLAKTSDGFATLGLVVRGEEITTESVWDDTDVVHVLQSEIKVQNFHSRTGLRLQSKPGASLVIKMQGDSAGFTAAGYPLDIDDRVGGTVQVIGQPGYPVVLTSLRDDDVGAGFDPLGRLVVDTNGDGPSSGAPGDWRSLQFLPYSNDRNVAVYIEAEPAYIDNNDSNGRVEDAERLGILAPNFAIGNNAWESAQEKSGDENRRLGFEVHGFIAPDDPTDVDLYSFRGYAGSEVWIDIDNTASALDAMVELLDAAGRVLARSADTQTDAGLDVATRGLAQPLEKDAWRGLDHFTVNPRDPGMRVVLPGNRGVESRYFVRVRSQPRYDDATTGVQHEAELSAAAPLAVGASSGTYQLRVRLRQLDEKPGSTVQQAAIRYATIGIDVQGLPRNSLLLGDIGERPTDDNGSFATAQYVGNLLQSDRGTLSIAGGIASFSDVDWYTFALNYEQIQSIAGLNDSAFSWATMFDIDYGDGFRGDLTLSVFDSAGRLIFVGRDSDVIDDQPDTNQGADFDDLSRGSAGKLDPFVGTVNLPAGGPTGGGGLEAGTDPIPPDPAAQLRYYVAVSSNAQLPESLNATFTANPLNHLVRLEPITSIDRIVEDRIGGGPARILDTQNLTAHITPFTLSDVTLFVSTSRSLVTIDAMRGVQETEIEDDYGANRDIGDLAMRSDGRLYAYAGLANTQNTAGRLELVDAGTGVRTVVGNDSIPNPPAATTQTDANLAPVAGVAGFTTQFQLSQQGVNAASLTGTVSYAGDTWVITNVGGGLVFTPVGQPAGTAAPVAGSVSPTGQVSITWNQVIAFNSVTLSVSYSFTGDPQAINTDVVDALAWRRAGVGNYPDLLYSVRDGANSRLYRANPASGSAAAPTPNPNGFGLRGVIQDPLNSLGIVTGMAFVGGTLYGVDTNGYLFDINVGTGQATLIDIDPATDADGDPLTPDPLSGVSFAGLTIGPQNLYGGALSSALFAIDTSGTLYSFDTTGNQLSVFDSDGDGVADASTITTPNLTGVTGVAFSPLDINLWHSTTRRGAEPGHGINIAPDNTRTTRTDGQTSMYFGLEALSRGSQFGGSTAWQQDLLSNPAIGNNYNLPGGAYGSLTTDSFSLAGYGYTDKPTLYFNYLLETEGAASDTADPDRENSMRDSARVLLSTDGGATWELLATNNSDQPRRDFPEEAELPYFTTASSRITPFSNQHVQELFDTANWRQARIDLGAWAGQSDLRLRFDFSTAGEFDPTQADANGNLINQIAGLANTTGDFNSPQRGQNNQFEGFYIDDIVVGFAERGEMVTAANGNDTGFVTVDSPNSVLTGEYQLEIRQGTEYVFPPFGIIETFDTNDRLEPVQGLSLLGQPLRGDQNVLQQQGQFVIANNIIAASLTYGVSIDAGVREGGSDLPHPGVPRNLPTLNNERLAPGAVVTNNVITGSGTAGILFSGDPNTGNIPRPAVPFGRIVNNTINGGDTQRGIGVQVTENAGPTLINNLFANLATGVSVDASSAGRQRTVVGASAYFNTATQVTRVTQTFPLVLTSDPFVNAGTGNFYLRPGTAAIDSAINSLQDRTLLVAVNSDIGVGTNPILAPDRDLYGQLRGDDPSQASAPGLGANVFKDRGAIDRVDFAQPSARLESPQDDGLVDRDPAPDRVRLERDAARGLTRFVLRLEDVGVGIDPATVSSAAFTLSRDGVPLALGSDYVFLFFPSSKQVVFEAAAVFEMGSYEIRVAQEQVNGGNLNVIRDLAGNTLLPNQADGTTSFTIELADVPAAPFGLVAASGDAQAQLSWQAAVSSATPLVHYEVQWATDGAFTSGVQAVLLGPTTLATVIAPLTNSTPYWFRVRAANAVGDSEWSNIAGPIVPMSIPAIGLLSDTGSSPADGVTNDGRVNVTGVVSGASWEYSTDGGASWTAGIGGQFILAEGLYPAGSVRVRQSLLGNFSSPGSNPSAWQIDQTPPASPVLALGPGIADPVPKLQATQPEGVVLVTGEPDATITVTFVGIGGTVVKPVVIGTGVAAPVTLTPADVNQLGNGLVSVSATQVDLAGNGQTDPAAMTSFTLETVAPTVTISSSRGTLLIGQTADISFALSAPSNDFTIDDVRVLGGTLVDFSGSGTAYTATFVPTAGIEETGSIHVPADSFTDAVGTGNLQGGPLSLVIDTIAPTVAVFAAPSGFYRSGTTVPITVTFSEPVRAGSTLTVTLNTGAVVVLTAESTGSMATGSYVVQPGQMTDALKATAIASDNTVLDVAGNRLVSSALPSDDANFGSGISVVIDGSVAVLTSVPFSTTSIRVNNLGVAVTQVPVRFTTPVSGVSLAAFELFLDGRPVSLRDAQVSGSGADYVLTLPALRANPSGIYMLVVRADTGIRALANGATMTAPGRIYWGKDRSVSPTVIESAGSIALAYDASGALHANDFPITSGGSPVDYQDMASLGWTAVAADVIDGVNTLVWRHSSGNLHLWRLSGSWALVRSEGWYAPQSPEYYATETAFGMDLDGDGVTGTPLTTIESAGLVRLSYDGSGRLFAGDSPITLGGGPVNYHDMAAQGWTAVAVDTIDGVNTLVWRHASGNLHFWKLSGAWAVVLSEGWQAPNSPDYYATETAFGMDFDGDGVTGAPLTTIEAAGLVPLAYDGAGRLYAGDSPITLGGNPVNYHDMAAQGWTAVAVDTNDGLNTLVWRHASGNLHLWRLSASWAHVLSEGWYAPGSAEHAAIVVAFGLDAPGTGLTIIESSGTVSLAHDATGRLYAGDTLITLGGNSVSYHDMAALGWTAVAVDTIDGLNTLVWRHASGNLHLWRLSAAWAHVASEGWYAPGSTEYTALWLALGMPSEGIPA